jgi:peptide deformylase
MEIIKDFSLLRKKSKRVKEITEETRKLVSEMKEIMEKENGVGLAAPQLGFLERIILVKENNETSVFINPVILEKSKEKGVLEEGCLSVPGFCLEIKRPSRIKIKALDLEGKEFSLELKDLPARIFQHETDHLNGVLIVDYLPLKDKIKNFFSNDFQKSL